MTTLLLTVFLFNFVLFFVDIAVTGGSVSSKAPIAEEMLRSVEGFSQTVSSINFANPIAVVRGIGGSLVGGLAMTIVMVKSLFRILLVDHAILSDGFLVYLRWFLVTVNGALFISQILPIMRGGRV